MRVAPGQPVTLALSVADREPLINLDPDGAWAALEADEHGWPGYAHSRPVRVGNGAANQHQLDGYGWVLDAAWLLTRAGQRLYAETRRAMRGFADQAAERWREPDAGIWEIRGDGAHHVHSKLMAWLALDRALGIAATHRTPLRQAARWHAERDAIADEVTSSGFSPELGSYTRSYGSNDLDAAVLVLPLLELEPRDSPRVRATIEAVRRELGAGGPCCTATHPARTACPAPKAPSSPVRSGWSKPSATPPSSKPPWPSATPARLIDRQAQRPG